MTNDGTHTYTYDAENRISKVDGGGTASYVYNENGQRARKTTGSTFTEYFFGPNGSVESEYNGSSFPVAYVYAGNRLVAEYKNSTTEFIHADHLGTTRLVTGVNQSIIDTLDFYPYGLQSSGDTATTHKFTGKERDAESGLDNFGKRYNASSMGRFMTPDPVFFQAAMLSDPQRFNLYAYVRNNPLSLTDPTGESIELIGDEEQRKKALQALQQAVGKDAGSYLYENKVTTTDANGNSTTKYYVGVRDGTGGQASVFGKMNSVAGELAPIIADTKNVQLNVVSAGTVRDDFGNTTNINARTPAATGIFGGNLRVNILDPSVPILPLDGFMMTNQQLGENTPGMVVGHELGHARGIMTGALPAETNPDSLRLENKVRTLQNPGAAQRMIHDCPPGACGSVPK